jgi:hypothetical protein
LRNSICQQIVRPLENVKELKYISNILNEYRTPSYYIISTNDNSIGFDKNSNKVYDKLNYSVYSDCSRLSWDLETYTFLRPLLDICYEISRCREVSENAKVLLKVNVYL